MPEASRLVPLRTAQPRWSHRDPVEDGPRFPPGSPKQAAWAAATTSARDRLRDMDAVIARTAHVTLDPVVYRTQLFDLAVGRFTIWTERGLAIISTETECRDYVRWVSRYVGNWLTYVAETCPHVRGLDELARRLRELAAQRDRDARRIRVTQGRTSASGRT